ncbi:YggS family pyridoxal phosphate-dependent enzyme [Aristaeella lactis]|nr:YggS family pyridoxal phosphate-dependent enzyme [Aristaeella lactis]QUA52539.1 YggS family pyridoxal phosphate-dependent enzyme [Aristaeella lactis]
MESMTREELERRVTLVRQELEEAANGRYPVPKLIAVTKTHSAEEILPLAEMGITEIGENRVQELLTKLPALRDSFRIHLIGRLQRNKVKQIVGDVCMIQSVDSEPLAMEIHNRALAAGKRMPVLVEISPAGEEQKGGVPFEETEAFLKKIAPLEGLEIRGLMAVMPLTEDREYLDGLFARTRELFDRLKDRNLSGAAMEELSMGMSGDYQLAAAHGATMVRVGSAIFGPRG